jgi:hypothetical protein
MRSHVPNAFRQSRNLNLNPTGVMRVARKTFPHRAQGGSVQLARAELSGVEVLANQVGLDVAGGGAGSDRTCFRGYD